MRKLFKVIGKPFIDWWSVYIWINDGWIQVKIMRFRMTLSLYMYKRVPHFNFEVGI